nr:hypothetical protein BaRGS_025909 [Batillaria attramentaria]
MRPSLSSTICLLATVMLMSPADSVDPVLNVSGKKQVVMLVDIHTTGAAHGDTKPQVNEAVLPVLLGAVNMVQRLQEDNVTIGLTVYNTSGSTSDVIRLVAGLVAEVNTTPAGVISMTSSTLTSLLSDLLRPTGVPHVHISLGRQMDDTQQDAADYLSTISRARVEATAKLLEVLHIRYFVLRALENPIAQNEAAHFRQLVHKSETLCQVPSPDARASRAPTVVFTGSDDNDEDIDIGDEMSGSRSEVVVVVGDGVGHVTADVTWGSVLWLQEILDVAQGDLDALLNTDPSSSLPWLNASSCTHFTMDTGTRHLTTPSPQPQPCPVAVETVRQTLAVRDALVALATGTEVNSTENPLPRNGSQPDLGKLDDVRSTSAPAWSQDELAVLDRGRFELSVYGKDMVPESALLADTAEVVLLPLPTLAHSVNFHAENVQFDNPWREDFASSSVASGEVRMEDRVRSVVTLAVDRLVTELDVVYRELCPQQKGVCEEMRDLTAVGEVNSDGSVMLSNMADRIPASICPDWCPQCLACPSLASPTSDTATAAANGNTDPTSKSGLRPTIFIPGEILVAGVLPVRQSGPEPFQCGDLNDDSEEARAEQAFLFAVETARQRYSSLLPHVSVGGILLDSCSDLATVLHVLGEFQSCRLDVNKDTDFLKDEGYSRDYRTQPHPPIERSQPLPPSPSLVVGYLIQDDFERAAVVRDTVRGLSKMVVVSAVPRMSEEPESGGVVSQYPTRLTVNAVLSIFTEFKWTQAYVVTSGEEEFVDMAEYLVDVVGSRGVCVVKFLQLLPGARNADSIASTLSHPDSASTPVVVFLPRADAVTLFRDRELSSMSRPWVISMIGDDCTPSATASRVIRGVDAILHAVDARYKVTCRHADGICGDMSKDILQGRLSLADASFTYEEGRVSFTETGEMAITLSILSYQPGQLVMAGTYRATGLSLNNSLVQFFATSERGVFVREVWAWTVLAIAVGGALVSMFFIFYVLFKGALSRRYIGLGLVLLVSLMLLYLACLPFLFTPSPSVCGLRYLYPACAHCLVLACLLVKLMALQDYRRIGLGGELSGINQGLSIFFVILVQVVSVLWWIFKTPFLVSDLDPLDGLMKHSCRFDRSDFVLCQTFVLFLIVLCAFYSVAVRHEKKNMGEAKLLLACCWTLLVLWLGWVPTLLLLDDRYASVISCGGVLATASVVLLVVFVPKVRMVSRLKYDLARKHAFRNGYSIDTDFLYERPYSLPGTLTSTYSSIRTYPKSLTANFDSSLSY